jgi:phage baseplate assembly protein W
MAQRSFTEFKKRQLGKGLVFPMQRIGGKDFHAAQEATLIRSCIMQILMTRPKELPWKPSFPGFHIEAVRHKNQKTRLLQQLRDNVERAILTWEPRVTSVRVTVESEDTEITVRIDWEARAAEHPESLLLVGPEVIVQDV